MIDIRFAGSDTTGNALSFVLWNLVTCRRAWENLCAEVRRLRRDQLNMSTLQHLSYLNAVIKEGVRPFKLAAHQRHESGGRLLKHWF